MLFSIEHRGSSVFTSLSTPVLFYFPDFAGHLVHAKRSLKFGPIQNVHGYIWSMPNGFR